MKTTAKKMNYALDITRRIPTTEAARDGGTEEKAKTHKGTWVKLNSEMFAFVEESQTTIIEVTEHTRGCACKAFTDSNLSLLCEHLIAFDDLKEPPQLMIYNDQKICRVLTEYLFTLGWSVEPDHWLYPSLDSPTCADAEENGVDDTDAKTPIDANPVQKTPPKANKPEIVHWECPKCGEEFDVEKSKLTDLKLNHMEVCKGKPVSKKRTQPAKKKTPTTKPKTKPATTASDPESDNPPKSPAPTPDVSLSYDGENINTTDVSKTDTTKNNEQTMNESPSIGATIAPAEHGSIVNIARAMCEVQKTELFAILNADNPFTRSKYADLSSVWAAIRKPLTDNGLSVIQTTEPYPGGVTVVTTLMHISGETLTTKLSAKVPEKPRDKNGQEQSNIQGLGSMITYLRRYSLAAMIGVCPADDDGESAMGRGG